jgi:hypothetical protein
MHQRHDLRQDCLFSGTFFKMFEAGANDFFDASQFGSPEVAHVIKALVDGAETIGHTRVQKCESQPYNKGVEEHGDTHREIELFVGHFGKSSLH